MSAEDIAQEVELRDWERNNTKRHAPVVYQPEDAGYGAAECKECGEEVHPVRRGYGFNTCIECATLAERHG